MQRQTLIQRKMSLSGGFDSNGRIPEGIDVLVTNGPPYGILIRRPGRTLTRKTQSYWMAGATYTAADPTNQSAPLLVRPTASLVGMYGVISRSINHCKNSPLP